jgi:serine/threonine-protein kinase
MNDRWQQVEKICQSALELEEGQRKAFIEQACAGDEGLRGEVESLLRFDKDRDRFIEQPGNSLARIRSCPSWGQEGWASSIRHAICG